MVDERILGRITDIIGRDLFRNWDDVFDQLVYDFSHISLLDERDLSSLSPSEASEELVHITEEVIMGYALELTGNRLPQDGVFWVRDEVMRIYAPVMSGEEALEYLNYLMYECPWRPWA